MHNSKIENFLKTWSYVAGFSPTQIDISSKKSITLAKVFNGCSRKAWSTWKACRIGLTCSCLLILSSFSQSLLGCSSKGLTPRVHCGLVEVRHCQKSPFQILGLMTMASLTTMFRWKIMTVFAWESTFPIFYDVEGGKGAKNYQKSAKSGFILALPLQKIPCPLIDV